MVFPLRLSSHRNIACFFSPPAAGCREEEEDGADGAEAEGAGWCIVLSPLLLLLRCCFFAKLFIIQMFLLKAERMKRLEKEKVSVSFILLCDHLYLLLFSS